MLRSRTWQEYWRQARKISVPPGRPTRSQCPKELQAPFKYEEAKTIVGEILAENPNLTVDQILDIGSIQSHSRDQLWEIQNDLCDAGLPEPNVSGV